MAKKNGEGELIESIMHQLIDEEALGVAFEMHRAIKLGYYELVYPDDRYDTARQLTVGAVEFGLAIP